MLISVITPCYNASDFIADTIESVINQTFKNWEMIIVDDGSTDKSCEIIEKYIRKDSRIKLIKLDVRSGSPAKPRNVGIERAKGDYIAFLDSDDLWYEDKLKKQIEFMETNNHAVSYSFYEKMDWQGHRNNRIIKGFPFMTYRKLLKFTAMAFLTMMFKRDAIGSTRFKNIHHEDYNFYLDILKKGYRAYNLNETTSLYRESRNSRSSNKKQMIVGQWNVLRNEQKIGLWSSACYMVTYAFHGLIKYIK